MAINRIDPTPARISTNLSIERQTPKTDFGTRVKAGIDTAAGAVANGAAIVGSFVPGGAIVSAAVSSVTNLTNNQTPGGGSSAVSSHYAATGIVNVGGGAPSGGVQTTVGGGTTGAGSMPGIGSTVGGSGNLVTGGSSGGGTLGQMNSDLVTAQQENAKLIQVQMSLQRENQVFSTVSNVLKTRHDTVKNTISNVR
jgi:hypothetical protein